MPGGRAIDLRPWWLASRRPEGITDGSHGLRRGRRKRWRRTSILSKSGTLTLPNERSKPGRRTIEGSATGHGAFDRGLSLPPCVVIEPCSSRVDQVLGQRSKRRFRDILLSIPRVGGLDPRGCKLACRGGIVGWPPSKATNREMVVINLGDRDDQPAGSRRSTRGVEAINPRDRDDQPGASRRSSPGVEGIHPRSRGLLFPRWWRGGRGIGPSSPDPIDGAPAASTVRRYGTSTWPCLP
jgi:hypothetical protein